MRTDQSSTLHYEERIFHTVFASAREVPYNPFFAEAAHPSRDLHDLRRRMDPTFAAPTASVRTAPDAVPEEEREMSDFDAITEESLVRKGGRKWSSFPGSIGAFIAEMDFGVAPPSASRRRPSMTETSTATLPPIWSPTSRQPPRLCSEQFGWRIPVGHIEPASDVLAAFLGVLTHLTRITLRSCCRRRLICRSSTSRA